MRLVVAADDLAARREREDAVARAVDVKSVPRRDGDAAGQQPVVGTEQRSGALALELGEGAVLVATPVVERFGDGGLGPQQQSRVGSRRTGQSGEAPRRLIAEAG